MIFTSLLKSMNAEWIKLPYFRKINGRKIHNFKCLKCGKIFKNHKYAPDHLLICRAKPRSQSEITNFIQIEENEEEDQNQDFSEFQRNLIVLFIGSNMSISQIGKSYFKNFLLSVGVEKEKIPSPYILRKNITDFSKKVYDDTYSILKNKIVSLIVDGTTSWSNTYYEISVFTPGIIKHIKLVKIAIASADCLKKTILFYIDKLGDMNISVVGICTDNGPNLKAACDKISSDFINGKCKIPLIRTSCTAHTAQLLLKDLYFSSSIFHQISDQTRQLVKWLRKSKIKKYYQKIKMNCPPMYSVIRWNSLYFCLQFVTENYDKIMSVIENFQNKKDDSNIELIPLIKYRETTRALKYIHDFTCAVETNYSTIGDAFKQINILKNNLKTSIPSITGIPEILNTQIDYRFSNTYDIKLAELAYILTDDGKKWLNKKKAKNDEIITKISKFSDITEEESKFIQDFDDDIKSIYGKLSQLCIFMKLDEYNAVEAFKKYLLDEEPMYDDPLDYWKNHMGANYIKNTAVIPCKDICQIAIRLLVLPSSEALCERVFSQLKYIHNSRRNSLKPDIIDSIMNIRFEMKMNGDDLSYGSDDDDDYDDNF